MLTFLLLISAIAPISVQSRAQSSGMIESLCDVPTRPELDPRYRIDNLIQNPLPLVGTFPNEPTMAPSTDVAYEVLVSDLRGHRQAPNLLLNDKLWIDVNGFSQQPIEELPDLTGDERSTVIDFFRLWSTCAIHGHSYLFDLLTDFGFGWICSRDDPFMALQSPASIVCPGGSISQTMGSFPLGLIEARWLSETRVGLIIADGSSYDEFGNLRVRFAQGSIWVLVMTEQGWRVDAIVGMVEILNASEPIVVTLDD